MSQKKISETQVYAHRCSHPQAMQLWAHSKFKTLQLRWLLLRLFNVDQYLCYTVALYCHNHVNVNCTLFIYTEPTICIKCFVTTNFSRYVSQ